CHAIEAAHSYLYSADSHFRHQSCHAIHHAPAEQRNTARQWREHRGAMGRGVVFPRVTCAALSPSDNSRSLVRATLWLAAAGFSMGAARAVYMGFLATLRDLRGGEDCVQHFAFPRAAAGSFAGA